MATTCQTIVKRAEATSALNKILTGDRAEMLSRIRAEQQEIFTVIAARTRDRFQEKVAITSSDATLERVFDLEALEAPVERVLQLILEDGREASQVDVLDVEAELAPRYIVRGQTLVEVENDWSDASGPVDATLVYVAGMTDIDPDGQLSQEVSVPDPWVDLLVMPLAMYLFQKDPGRDPAEFARLAALLGSFGDETAPPNGRRGAFLSYLQNYGGVESRRFIQPTPRASSKR